MGVLRWPRENLVLVGVILLAFLAVGVAITGVMAKNNPKRQKDLNAHYKTRVAKEFAPYLAHDWLVYITPPAEFNGNSRLVLVNPADWKDRRVEWVAPSSAYSGEYLRYVPGDRIRYEVRDYVPNGDLSYSVGNDLAPVLVAPSPFLQAR